MGSCCTCAATSYTHCMRLAWRACCCCCYRQVVLRHPCTDAAGLLVRAAGRAGLCLYSLALAQLQRSYCCCFRQVRPQVTQLSHLQQQHEQQLQQLGRIDAIQSCMRHALVTLIMLLVHVWVPAARATDDAACLTKALNPCPADILALSS